MISEITNLIEYLIVANLCEFHKNAPLLIE